MNTSYIIRNNIQWSEGSKRWCHSHMAPFTQQILFLILKSSEKRVIDNKQVSVTSHLFSIIILFQSLHNCWWLEQTFNPDEDRGFDGVKRELMIGGEIGRARENLKSDEERAAGWKSLVSLISIRLRAFNSSLLSISPLISLLMLIIIKQSID